MTQPSAATSNRSPARRLALRPRPEPRRPDWRVDGSDAGFWVEWQIAETEWAPGNDGADGAR